MTNPLPKQVTREEVEAFLFPRFFLNETALQECVDGLFSLFSAQGREEPTFVHLSDGQTVDARVYEVQKAMFDALGVKVVPPAPQSFTREELDEAAACLETLVVMTAMEDAETATRCEAPLLRLISAFGTAPQSFGGWRDIESADLKSVAIVLLAFQDHPPRPGFWDGETWQVFGYMEESAPTPYFWQPLPEPPAPPSTDLSERSNSSSRSQPSTESVRSAPLSAREAEEPAAHDVWPPEPPWPVGSAHNSRRTGWSAFFGGRGREDCPYPLGRQDLRSGYREGWDAAQATDLSDQGGEG